jgi:hypothetical protein
MRTLLAATTKTRAPIAAHAALEPGELRVGAAARIAD